MKKIDPSNIVELSAPKSWNELNLKQLRMLARMIARGVTPAYRRQLLFMAWTGIRTKNSSFTDEFNQRYYLYQKGKRFFYLSVPEYASLLRKVDFIQEPSRLHTQLLPSVWLLWHKHYGPSNKLFNISYDEFLHAEAAFKRYVSNMQHTEHLNTLCAVLYRPGNGINPKSEQWQGDARIAFNDYSYQRRARLWKWVPVWQKVAVFLFYNGCREALYESHKALREESTIGENKTSDLEKHRQLINTLNQGDITKNKAIIKAPLWDVMAMLNHLVEQNKKLRKK